LGSTHLTLKRRALTFSSTTTSSRSTDTFSPFLSNEDHHFLETRRTFRQGVFHLSNRYRPSKTRNSRFYSNVPERRHCDFSCQFTVFAPKNFPPALPGKPLSVPSTRLCRATQHESCSGSSQSARPARSTKIVDSYTSIRGSWRINHDITRTKGNHISAS
jgi:hypothetical protein